MIIIFNWSPVGLVEPDDINGVISEPE